MWKKDETPGRLSKPVRPSAPDIEKPVARPPAPEVATIGRTIKIKGKVTGDEDLLIEGRVDGSVNLTSHAVTVGTGGHIRATITARIVTIKGNVQGNLTAEEQIVLLSSASVEGDLKAPRVVLEDGANFRGGIDMGNASAAPKSGAPGKPSRKRAPETRPPKAESGSAKAKHTVH